MKKFSKILVVLFVLLMMVSCGKKKEEKPVVDEVEPVITEPVEKEDEVIDEGYKLYVIFGVDSRNNAYGAGTRSDSIMILGVNKTKKTVRIASILRDTLSAIEGHSYEKITHAHSYGGPELALATINDNYDLEIEDYLTVNFNSAAKLIDLVGGVDIEIHSDEVNQIKGFSYNGALPATLHLNGEQAVSFSRIRHADGGDFKRSERQRIVLSDVFEKAKSLSTIEKTNIASEMFNTINTNVKESETLSLLMDISSYEIEKMNSFPQVFYAGILDTNGVYRYVEVPCDLIDMVTAIHEFFEMEYEPSENILNKNSDLKTYADVPNYDIRNEYGNGLIIYDEPEVEEGYEESYNEQ